MLTDERDCSPDEVTDGRRREDRLGRDFNEVVEAEAEAEAEAEDIDRS